MKGIHFFFNLLGNQLLDKCVWVLVFSILFLLFMVLLLF